MSRRQLIRFVSAATAPWGAEHSLRSLLSERPGDIDVEVLCASREVEDFFRGVAHTHRIVARDGKVGRLLDFAAEVRRRHANGDINVLFSLQLLPVALMLRMSPAAVSLVADVHDAPVGSDRLLVRILVRLIPRRIYISEFTRSHLSDRSGVVIPRPIDPVQFTREERLKENGTCVIGIIGRLDPEKRIEVVLDAVRLSQHDIHLKVFGDPMLGTTDYVEGLHTRARGLPVTFEGSLPKGEIYPGLDAVVVANEREPSGRSVGEAMSYGLVVIAPDSGGASEYYTDETSGLTYRALNAHSLAAIFDRLAADPLGRREMGRCARLSVSRERAPRSVSKAYFSAIRGEVHNE